MSQRIIGRDDGPKTTVSVKPLQDDAALESGSEALADLIVLSIALVLVTFGVRMRWAKSAAAAEREAELQNKLLFLEEDIERLWNYVHILESKGRSPDVSILEHPQSATQSPKGSFLRNIFGSPKVSLQSPTLPSPSVTTTPQSVLSEPQNNANYLVKKSNNQEELFQQTDFDDSERLDLSSQIMDNTNMSASKLDAIDNLNSNSQNNKNEVTDVKSSVQKSFWENLFS